MENIMYKRYTANPKHETEDCGIRSFAHAEQKEWRDVASNLFNIALDEYLPPNDYRVLSIYAEKNGYPEEFSFPGDEPTLSQFVKENCTGTYVVLLENHAVSVIDGTYYDLTDCADSKVISYWKIK